MVFWLDAHQTGNIRTSFDQKNLFPILDEIEIIKKHPIKTHTILIDDRRSFGTPEWNYLKEQDVLDILYSINKNYKIEYLDSNFFKQDIIMASV